jgi:hypothetical protein
VSDISLSVLLSTGGAPLEVNSRPHYYVGETSFNEKAVTKRRNTAKSPFIDGEWVYNVRKENVTEALEVYVTGATIHEREVLQKALTDALDQAHFTMTRTIEDSRVVWSCYSSDYTISSPRPLMLSKMCIVKAQVLCDPFITEVAV